MNELDLFTQALNITNPAERAEFLDQACAGNPELRRRLEDLLAGHDLSTSPLDQPPVMADNLTMSVISDAEAPTAKETSPTLPRASKFPSAEGIGAVISGRYTLVEVIGEGGMGSVYRASQTEPVKRDVALKLIKTGMDSRGVLARFDAERQALAMMDHPNIARIYDGGVTPSGQPFFVMELVKGEPLTDYCDKKRLSIKARLELFVAVCQAVQHAHQKGIIHRDLKPSNILVTEVDGKPTPKVIDFGVAKATEVKLTDMSIADLGAIVGTPAYMSPEQADPSSMDIDTRSDVYSLGVILYELLAGSPPIDAKQFQRGAILEMLRMVREDEPPRPSTKLSTAEKLPKIASNRSLDPAQLRKAVRGDLDWVVMKALEKDRDRRYETANGFAADVSRHLANEPVEAAPPSRSYRMRKFVRKHRGPVIAASLVLISLLAGITGTALGLIRADYALKDRDKALKNEKDRVKERDRAVKIADSRAEELTYRLGVSSMVLASSAYHDNNAALSNEYLDSVPTEQRGWEWHYLKRQIRGGLFTIYGHTGPVTGISFSRDGNRIATSSSDNTAKVWDARTGTPLFDLKGHFATVNSLSFNPDGTRIITGSVDKTVKAWDAETGNFLFELKGHADEVTSVAFSPNGGLILSGSRDGSAKVWNAKTQQLALGLKGHSLGVTTVSFSPDGMRILTGSLDNTVKVWDAKAGKPLLEFRAHNGPVHSASFSPDCKRIVTGGYDGMAKVWDASTGAHLLDLKGHLRYVNSVSFSPDGTTIVTGSWDNSAKVWDARTGNPLINLVGHTHPVLCVSFSPDATRIVTASWDETAKVWDARTGNHYMELKENDRSLNSVAFSPDGKRVVTSGSNGGKVWDARTGTLLYEIAHKFAVLNASFSPDGKWVATCGSDQGAKLWDAETGKPLFELRGHSAAVTSLSFSPDGTRIVTGSSDKTAKVWDTKTGLRLLDLKGHSELLSSVSFSPDGKQIVSGGYDGMAKVWDAKNGSLLANINHMSWIKSASFSPDNARIVTGGNDGTVKVWNARTGTRLLDLKGHSFAVESVQFNRDGTRIVSAGYDQSVKVWDARTGTSLLDLKGHTAKVASATFSRDGRRIASISADGTVKIWEARPLARNAELDAMINANSNVAWSLDGHQVVLVTAHQNQPDTIWDTQSGQQLKAALIPLQTWPGRISPNGRLIAHDAGDRVELVPLHPDSEELDYRRDNTLPNISRYSEAYDEAKVVGDEFAAKFYLQLLPAAERSQRLAKEVIGPMFARLGLRDEVLAVLRAHPLAEPSVQKACIEMAETWDEEIPVIANLAWTLVMVPGRPEGDYRLGLRLAEKAHELFPDVVGVPNVLGAAQFRRGRFREALATLTRANELNQYKIPADLTFLALVQHDLGQSDKARSTLIRLRELVKERATDPKVTIYMRETDANFLREAEVIEFDLAFPANPFAR